MNIPTDYELGYEKARAVAPDIADNYVAHTLIGDPLAEAMTEDLRGVQLRRVNATHRSSHESRR